jgi:RNA polymerase sigma-70 factor (ECF subfamily)
MLDIKILDKFTAGDRKAFNEIYRVLSPGMYGLCLRYARCADDAQDILQEAFIKVFQACHTFNRERHIAAWVKRIVVNTALNYIKKNYKKLKWTNLS